MIFVSFKLQICTSLVWTNLDGRVQVMSTTYQLVYHIWLDAVNPDLLLPPPSLSRIDRPRCRTKTACQRWMDNAYLKVKGFKKVLKYFPIGSFDGIYIIFKHHNVCQFVNTCGLHFNILILLVFIIRLNLSFLSIS